MRTIIFGRNSIQALQQNRKTLTHRILNVKLFPGVTRVEYKTKIAGTPYWWGVSDEDADIAQSITCPYGHTGDELAVLEDWAHNGGRYVYAADVQAGGGNFSPAVEIPLEGIRYALEIVDVDCQPIRDITERQAVAEGLWKSKSGWMPGEFDEFKPAYIQQFKTENPSLQWTDTWVWRIRFKKKEKGSWLDDW